MLKPTKPITNQLQAIAAPAADLVDRIIEMLQTDFPDMAETLAAYESDIRAEFSGERCYIRGTPATDRQRRVSAVLGMLANGRNATTIARRLQIPRPTVYRIIKQAAQPQPPGRMV